MHNDAKPMTMRKAYCKNACKFVSYSPLIEYMDMIHGFDNLANSYFINTGTFRFHSQHAQNSTNSKLAMGTIVECEGCDP